MAIIANRIKNKGQYNELLKLIRYFTRKSSAIFLTLFSIVLILFSGNFISSFALEVVGRINQSIVPIHRFLFDNANYLAREISNIRNLREENIFLKRKIENFNNIEEKAFLLEQENKYLKKILKVVDNTNVPFCVAKMLSKSTSPFASYAIVSAGSVHGVKINDIVTSNKILIGRITEVSPNYANVMLIDDYNSRIPIITSKSRLRGILSMENNRLKIIYLNSALPIIGENIYTSGDGKIYPDGIKVGKIIDVNDQGVFVDPGFSFKEINFVLLQRVNKSLQDNK